MQRKNNNIPEYFNTRQAEHLSGLKRTMLDYLVRTNLLIPSYSKGKVTKGLKRKYSFGDIVLLRTLKTLLDNGISILRLSKALNQLGKTHKNLKPEEIPSKYKYLVTNGKEVFFRSKRDALENLSANSQMAFSFVLDLKPTKDEIIVAINKSSFKKIA